MAGRQGKHWWNGKPYIASKTLTDMTDAELDELEKQVALARERGSLPPIEPDQRRK